MNVGAGHIVRLEYELKLKDGTVVESSAKSGAIQYVHGEGKMLPALEARLAGMAVGEEKRGTIPASEVVGDESQLPETEIGRQEFPKGVSLDVGSIFEAKGPKGEPLRFKVLAVDDRRVRVRLMPAIVGQDLDFRVRVLGIDDPKTGRRVGTAPPPPPADALGFKEDE